MNQLIAVMNTVWGRAARSLLGVALVAWGLWSLGSTTGTVVAIVGLLPLAMGAWGRCLLEVVTPRPLSR